MIRQNIIIYPEPEEKPKPKEPEAKPVRKKTPAKKEAGEKT